MQIIKRSNDYEFKSSKNAILNEASVYVSELHLIVKRASARGLQKNGQAFRMLRKSTEESSVDIVAAFRWCSSSVTVGE